MAREINIADWFEIPVHDLDRARLFYESVFNVELSVSDFGTVKMAFFPMSSASYGATGALVKGEVHVPSHRGVLIYMAVDDVEETLDKVDSSGGKTLMPKTSIGEYGFIAHFQDSEGNRLGLHSMK
jgi:predicted enzyme related to lactoylglutathione lyase